MSPLLPSHRALPGNSGPLPPRPAEIPDTAGTISFHQALAVVRRRFKLIIAMAFLGAMVGMFIASREPASYRASAMLRLAGERRALTGDNDVAPGLGRTTDPMLSMIELLRSRTVLGAVVDSLGLQLQSQVPGVSSVDLTRVKLLDPSVDGDTILLTFQDQEVVAGLKNRVVKAPYGEMIDLGPVQFAVRGRPSVGSAAMDVVMRERMIDELNLGMLVTQRLGTDIIDVAYIAADPRLAQQIVNTTVNAFEELNTKWARARSRNRREFLAEQLASTDSSLARAQADLSSFRSRQQLANSRDKLSAEQGALIELDAQRAQLEADRNTFSTLLTKIRSNDEAARSEALRALATSPAMADNPAVSQLYTQLLSQQFRLDSMTTGQFRAAATNPDVVNLKTLIRGTQQRLGEAVSSHVGQLGARIGALGDLRRQTGASISVLPALAEEEMRLTRRVEALASMGDDLNRDYQRARMAEEVEAGDVEIVNLADLPYSPVLASSTLKLALGLGGGLVFGLILAYLLEALNTSVRRPEDLETVLQVPGLAVIPPILRADAKPSGIRGLLGSGKAKRITSTSPMESTQAFSVGIEAFRNLRTSLIWLEGGEHLKTLVVTSAAPGEGKTLTAANLAVTLARDGLRALLVDCDIRRPRIHGLFRLPRTPGLMELLAVTDTPDDGQSLQSIIRESSVPGLSVLTCGALPSNAANLLSGTRMRVLLRELQEQYDVVVLDTPPVLATADAGIVASLADGVLLVVRAGQTDRQAAQHACHQLSIVGARVVGTVLNDPGGELASQGDFYYPYDYAAERE